MNGYSIQSAAWGQAVDVEVDPATGEKKQSYRVDPTVLRLNVEFTIDGVITSEAVDIHPYLGEDDVHRQLRDIVVRKVGARIEAPSITLGELKVVPTGGDE
jgi:hypothetical protein